MKKLLIIPFIALAVGCTSKPNHGEGNQAAEISYDSITDSVVDEEQVLDSIPAEAAISDEEIASIYKSGISLKKGKESKKWVGDTTDPDITLPVTLTNNMGITLSPDDYIITYTEEIMGDDIEFDASTVKRNKTKKGPEIEPGESVEVKLFERCALKIMNPKVKIKISKEEFARRYREENS